MNSRSRELKNLVHQLWRVHASSDRETCSCYGVTSLQGLVLMEISLCNSLSMQQLAKHMHLAVSTMSRVVDKLEESGLVSREMDPNDRRAVLCALTEAGEEKARQLDACYDEFFERLISSVAEEDLPGFLRGLKAVVKQMQVYSKGSNCADGKER